MAKHKDQVRRIVKGVRWRKVSSARYKHAAQEYITKFLYFAAGHSSAKMSEYYTHLLGDDIGEHFGTAQTVAEPRPEERKTK